MNADLTSCIVRIIRPDGKTADTGFVVAGGLIATCAHVISKGARGGSAADEVELIFQATGEKRSAQVVPEWWRAPDSGDVAILRLEGPLPQGVRPLPLGSSVGTNNHPFQTFGFPPVSPEEGIWGDGHILNETLMQGSRVLQISSPQVTPGFSGAPVLDTVSRRVVGMVTAIAREDEYGRMAETAFITPTETLRLICPQLRLSEVQPYLGLASFREQDAGFFFGRKREIDRLISSLKSESRFLAVMGPSGSGKSSVIQAGLIPALRRGAVPGSDRWEFITARPGDRPLQNLEAEGLVGASQGLAEAVRAWLASHEDRSRMVIILDQFEELLAVASPQVRQDFLKRLRDLLETDLRLTLMLVMRDDFFSSFARDAPPELFERVQRGFVHISAGLEESDLKEIITGPAERVGLQFEEGLVEVICKDVMETTAEGERAGRSTVLPLLEFALTELWMRRREGYLTHDAYAAIGGVTGSLTQWADQAYQSLVKDVLGDVARRVLTELVSLGDERQGLPDSRRRRSLDDLVKDPKEKDQVHQVLGTLADARLVATSFDRQSNQETFEIIHDSLIREWARLRQWLREDRNFLSWDREMEKKAASWEEGKRDEGRLLRGLDLDEAQRWLAQRSSDIGQEELRYIQASLELQERERTEKERRRKRNMQYLAAFSVVALTISAIAIFEWNQADRKTEEALALYLASQSEQITVTSGNDYARKVLLAVESLRHKETAVGDLALRRSMALLAPPLAQMAHNSSVSAVAFSPDGTKALTGSYDDGARLWDVASSQEIYRIAQNDSVLTMTFSADGTKVLIGSSDNMALIWDVSTGQQVHRLAHEGRVVATAFSPDGTMALTGSYDGTARIWDVSTGQEVHRLTHRTFIQEGLVLAVAFSPDCTMVLTGSDDSTARIWNVSTGQEVHRLAHDGWVEAVTFSPDGTMVLTGSDDSTARIWDVSTGQGFHRLAHDDSVLAVTFSPDGTKALTGSEDRTARIWDVSSGQEVHRLVHDDSVLAVAFSPNGTMALTGSRDDTARLWDVSTGQGFHRLAHDDSVLAMTFSSDDTKVLTGSDDGTARIWNVSTGQELHRLAHDDSVYAVAFNQDGTMALTGGLDNMAWIWDVSTGQKVHRLAHDSLEIAWHGCTGVAFSPDGSKVLTGSDDGTARIWDVASGQELHRLPHEDRLYAVAFSPDGTKALTGSYDNTARIWDVASGQEVHKLPHKSRVMAVTFSPDGTKVLTGSIDGTVRVWDVSSGQEIHSFAHDGVVTAVAFSPDGTKFASSSEDKTAWIWPVSTKDLIREACGCLASNMTTEDWKRYLEVSDCLTCPSEGMFKESASPLQSLLNDPKGFLTGSAECQPCIAEPFRNRK